MKLTFLNELQGQVRESEESCITIGSDGHDVKLDIPGIVENHAHLEEIDGQWMISRDDADKILLNGEEVQEQANLSNGDIVKLTEQVEFKVEFDTVASHTHKDPSLEDLLFQDETDEEKSTEDNLEDLPRLSSKFHESFDKDKLDKVEPKASKKIRDKTDGNGVELKIKCVKNVLRKNVWDELKVLFF